MIVEVFRDVESTLYKSEEPTVLHGRENLFLGEWVSHIWNVVALIRCLFPKPLTIRDGYDVVAEFMDVLFSSFCACPEGRVVVLFITRMTMEIISVVFVTGLRGRVPTIDFVIPNSHFSLVFGVLNMGSLRVQLF